jgi:hypothetical protein
MPTNGSIDGTWNSDCWELKKRESSVCRSVAEVRNILLDLRSFVLRKKHDLKKRGKILNLCALVRVR